MLDGWHCQFDRVWSHLGDRPPGLSVREYLASGHASKGHLGYINGCGEVCLSCGRAILWLGPWTIQMGKRAKQQHVFMALYVVGCGVFFFYSIGATQLPHKYTEIDLFFIMNAQL